MSIDELTENNNSNKNTSSEQEIKLPSKKYICGLAAATLAHCTLFYFIQDYCEGTDTKALILTGAVGGVSAVLGGLTGMVVLKYIKYNQYMKSKNSTKRNS